MHDYEPGIAANGLFWTIPIPRQAAEVNLGQGTARFHMANLPIPDFHDFFNSIGLGNPPIPSVPAVVSFDTWWDGTGGLTRIRDAAKGFVGDFIDSQATIFWKSASTVQHFAFVSDAADSSQTISAVIGRERNGVNFR